MTPHRPQYPELTPAQWSVIAALTDQRCANILEAADFISDLSPEAKAFLKSADRAKIAQMIANLEFYRTSRAIWRFLLVGGSFLIGLATVVKFVNDFVSVKFK